MEHTRGISRALLTDNAYNERQDLYTIDWPTSGTDGRRKSYWTILVSHWRRPESPSVYASVIEICMYYWYQKHHSTERKKERKKNTTRYSGLRRHTSRRRQRMRIHCGLSLRHILHHRFPISSLINKFLTLDLALSEQLNTVYEAFEPTRLFPQRVALEPALREELVDLREECFCKGDALRFAVCAKRLGPAHFQAVEPGDEDPV
jgi:hypothetical protein